MKLSKILEKFCYCALMVLLASVLIALTITAWSILLSLVFLE